MFSHNMSTFVFLFLFLFSNPVSPSSSPDRYFKSLSSSLHRRTTQEYLELRKPLSSDFVIPSCSHPILHHSFGNTIGSPPFSVPYFPPPDCPSPWSRVILQIHASCRGDQYDRIAGLWLGGAELLRTSTPEPTEAGIFWNVRKDVTRYSSLFIQSNLSLTMMLENVINNVFTGVYHVNVTLFFYKVNGKSEFKSERLVHNSPSIPKENSRGLFQSPADLVIPISDTGDKGFWFRIESESDIHSKQIQIPRNTHRAVLELYVSFHGDDEFWYSNPPDSYIRMNNLTTGRGNGAYREVYVTIDGEFVASEIPFPVIFTGGINPLFWEPVVAVGAFNLPVYEFDLSPFLGILLDGKRHNFAIGVDDSIPFWLVDANLHLWLDHGSSSLQAKSVVYKAPALRIKRGSKFKGLDGAFKIEGKRKTQFVGWVKSKEGNLTTRFLQEFKFKNLIRFQGNGTRKSVKQRINGKSEVRVETDNGIVLARAELRKTYPLNVLTATLPRSKDTYLMVTNVSHAFIEKFSSGDFFSSVQNRQDSNGWMVVKDHDVLSGEATTLQIYTCKDEFGCYSRIVNATNGWLVKDNSSFSCVTSL